MTHIPKPKKKKWYRRWWIWLIGILLLLIIGISTAIGSALEQSAQAEYAYLEESTPVANRSLRKTISTNGEIVADEVVRFTLSVPSKVTEVPSRVGDDVSEGDVLVKTEAQEITAPFDGRVLALDTFVGDTPQIGVPVLEFGYRSSHIEFFASDSEVVDLDTGQEASITVPTIDDGDTEYAGEVTFVDTQKTVAQAALGGTGDSGYEVHISTGDMPEELTRLIGLGVDVEVTVGEEAYVVSVNRGAVQEDADGNEFVYMPVTVTDDFVDRAKGVDDVTTLLEKVEVETGFAGDEFVEIESGLESGDSVLLYITPSNSQSPF